MDKLDLAGLTNALTDIIVNVSEKELALLGISKGAYKVLSSAQKENLFEILSKKEKKLSAAGSPANVIFNSAILGLDTALLGTIGNDTFGKKYLNELNKLKISPILGIKNGDSGTCYVLLTPDGERTCIANMGVAGSFNFDLKNLKQAKIFHTSGYELISNPQRVMESIYYAKKIGAKISFDLADASMIRKQRSCIEEIVKKTDILFMTEEESKELTAMSSLESLNVMSKICDFTILKKGSKGSIVQHHKEKYEIPIYPVKVISTCGAGDAYASGFLFAHTRNFPLRECGNMASYIASRVCAISASHL